MAQVEISSFWVFLVLNLTRPSKKVMARTPLWDAINSANSPSVVAILVEGHIPQNGADHEGSDLRGLLLHRHRHPGSHRFSDQIWPKRSKKSNDSTKKKALTHDLAEFSQGSWRLHIWSFFVDKNYDEIPMNNHKIPWHDHFHHHQISSKSPLNPLKSPRKHLSNPPAMSTVPGSVLPVWARTACTEGQGSPGRETSSENPGDWKTPETPVVEGSNDI